MFGQIKKINTLENKAYNINPAYAIELCVYKPKIEDVIKFLVEYNVGFINKFKDEDNTAVNKA